jgi:hypothetical protein
MTLLRLSALLLLTVAFVGCEELPKKDSAKAGPFYTPANVKAGTFLPSEIRRVIVLPVSGGPTILEETLLKLDSVVQTELGRVNRFEVIPLSREALGHLVGKRSVSSVEALPPDFFAKIAKEYAAEAVLFTDVTAYSAYAPLSLGLRTKLARLSDKEIVWSADNLFSADDPAVANSARRRALKLGTDHGPVDLSHTILQNPLRFAAYATAETYETLPLR